MRYEEEVLRSGGRRTPALSFVGFLKRSWVLHLKFVFCEGF